MRIRDRLALWVALFGVGACGTSGIPAGGPTGPGGPGVDPGSPRLTGTWSAPMQIAGEEGKTPSAAQPAVDGKGVATIVWSESTLWATQLPGAVPEPAFQISSTMGYT